MTQVLIHGSSIPRILESILTDEETDLDWLEARLDQVKQMGIRAYLAEQIIA